LCEGQGDFCMFGPGLITIFIVDVIVAYSVGLIIYKLIVKPKNKQLVLTAIYLLIYFFLLFGVFVI
jgi:hypothetical protein